MKNPDFSGRLYLVDGSSYIFRAYHGMPQLSNARGESTGAILGFYRMLQKTLREGAPTHCAVAFDPGGRTFRHELYAEYKANRSAMPEDLREQIPTIHKVVLAMGLPLVVKPGFEADDVIATLALQGLDEGFEVTIVTGDKDFIQLLRPGLRIYDGMYDRALDVAASIKKFGVPPELALDAMALIGDSSDNVPGVKGIGPKGAGKLLEQFGSLDALLARLPEVEAKGLRSKLEAGVEMARLSRTLVTIDTAVELDQRPSDFAYLPAKREALQPLFERLNFDRELQELRSGAAPAAGGGARRVAEEKPADPSEEPPPSKPETGELFPSPVFPVTIVDRSAYQLIQGAAGLETLAATLESAPRFAFDTETTSLDPMQADLVGLSFSWAEGEAAYLPVGHCEEALLTEAGDRLGQLDWKQVRARLGPLLEDPAKAKVAQHTKYDALVLERHGLRVRGVIADPLVLDYLLDPGKTSHGLDALSNTYLRHTPIAFSEVAGKGKAKLRFDQVPLEIACPYAAEDADLTLRLATLLEPKVRDAGLWPLYEELERPLSGVLQRMQAAGVKVNREALERQSDALGVRLTQLEAEIHAMVGHDFKINSPKQLAEVLFVELGLPAGKKTKSGFSTKQSVLEGIAHLHPLPAAILDYRQLSKLKSTYLDTLPELIHPQTGRIHSSFSQTTAATGRLASSNPNLQNIPVRSEEGRRIREAFVAEPGRLLVSADYSQIELRVLAHFAEDKGLVDAFMEGQDIHTRTAAQLLGEASRPLESVTVEERRIAKAINFGVLYGMSAFRLAGDLGIERSAAAAFIQTYFDRYPGIRSWIDATLEEARHTGMVQTLMGRRRLLPALKASNHVLRQAAERMAINTPIQGSAADIIKVAMLNVDAQLPQVFPDAQMILQVHDELIIELPAEQAEAAGAWLAETMASAATLRVPLSVDLGIGESWASAH